MGTSEWIAVLSLVVAGLALGITWRERSASHRHTLHAELVRHFTELAAFIGEARLNTGQVVHKTLTVEEAAEFSRYFRLHAFKHVRHVLVVAPERVISDLVDWIDFVADFQIEALTPEPNLEPLIK